MGTALVHPCRWGMGRGGARGGCEPVVPGLHGEARPQHIAIYNSIPRVSIPPGTGLGVEGRGAEPGRERRC